MEKKNILIIPDACNGNSSGAIVCQMAVRMLQELGHNIIVFSEDINDTKLLGGNVFLNRKSFSSKSNIFSFPYSSEYRKVLDQYGINVVFILGSITNKPLCYLEEAYKRRLKVIVKIFMQDFFCAKFYANDRFGICVKCLKNPFNAIQNHCCGRGWQADLTAIYRMLVRKRLKTLLPKADYVITSTDEQIGFYKQFGIPLSKCIKTPLYFNTERFLNVPTSFGDYYIGIAQMRVEKGFHLLPNILKHCSESVKIILAYANENQTKKAENDELFKPYIESGKLIVRQASWKTGLLDLVANSKGVIIPSIWPTTTEFGLLEALALQKCVFCFKVGIHAEKINNGVNGYAFPIAYEVAFAKALEDFNEDKFKAMLPGITGLYKELTDYNGWLETLKSLL